MQESDIQQRIKDILTILGVAYSGVSIDTLAGQTIFRIQTDESALLIGARGERIEALNTLIKRMIEKESSSIRFIIDVNDYKTSHIKEVQSTTLLLAERARSLKYDVEMQPMNGYDRMIVHATLTDDNELLTESRGDGGERRVVIKYVSK